MKLQSKFPLPLPDIWLSCLDSSEMAYTMAFSLAVPTKESHKSPLDSSILEDIENNKIELDSEERSHEGYYCFSVPQIDEDQEAKYISFEATASTSLRGSYSSSYSEPPEFPEQVLENVELDDIEVFVSERSKISKKDFGVYPDFTYEDFLNALKILVESTTDYEDTELDTKKLSEFPRSIVEKIEKYTKSAEFFNAVVEFLDVIPLEELKRAIEVFGLDMEKYRGKIAAKKFGL